MWARFVGVVGVVTVDAAVVRSETCAPEFNTPCLDFAVENAIFCSYRAEKLSRVLVHTLSASDFTS